MNSPAKSKKIFSRAKSKSKKDSLNTLNSDLSLSQHKKGTLIRDCDLRSTNAVESSEGQSASLSTFHPDFLADLAYFRLSKNMLPDGNLLDAASNAGLDLQKQQCPTDALERLTLTQILLAHARICSLTGLLAKQTAPAAIASISQALERETRTFERLLRAYRQPRNPGVGYSIGQVNVAHQQVIEPAKARGDFQKKESRRHQDITGTRTD